MQNKSILVFNKDTGIVTECFPKSYYYISLLEPSELKQRNVVAFFDSIKSMQDYLLSTEGKKAMEDWIKTGSLIQMTSETMYWN